MLNKKKCAIFIGLLLISSLSLTAQMSQKSYLISGNTLSELRAPKSLLPLSYPIFTKVIQLNTHHRLLSTMFNTKLILAQQKLKSYHGKAPEAFFCKLEYRLQKRAGFPIRFRLGEVGYQMRMEGK